MAEALCDADDNVFHKLAKAATYYCLWLSTDPQVRVSKTPGIRARVGQF